MKIIMYAFAFWSSVIFKLIYLKKGNFIRVIITLLYLEFGAQLLGILRVNDLTKTRRKAIGLRLNK